MKPLDSLNYRYVGRSTDGLLIFEDRDHPSGSPQYMNLEDEALTRCHSTHVFIDGNRFFAVTERHAEVRGFLHLVLGAEDKAGPH